MKKIFLLVVVSCMFIPNVYANTTPFYINNNGIEFTRSEYNKFLQLEYQKEEIAEFTEDLYNNMKNFAVGQNASVSEYYEDIYVYKSKASYDAKEEPIHIISKKIDKIEYALSKKKNGYGHLNLLQNTLNTKTVNTGENYYETTYKKLTITITKDTMNFSNRFVAAGVIWKIMPSVRSYDIMAMRINSNAGWFNLNTQSGSYKYTVGATPGCDITSSLTNTVAFANNNSAWNKKTMVSGGAPYGIGVTHQLASNPIACTNDMGIIIKSEITAMNTNISSQATTPTSALTVYASYQHATSNVSYSNIVNSYEFLPSGLGGVISFTNEIRNKYDAMGGISLSY